MIINDLEMIEYGLSEDFKDMNFDPDEKKKTDYGTQIA